MQKSAIPDANTYLHGVQSSRSLSKLPCRSFKDGNIAVRLYTAGEVLCVRLRITSIILQIAPVTSLFQHM